MKRFLIFAAALLCAACGKSVDAVSPEPPIGPSEPVVTTLSVKDYDADYALLGGWVSGIDVATLDEVGVQYLVQNDETNPSGEHWTQAVEVVAAAPAERWTLRIEELEPETCYAVRAFVGIKHVRYYAVPEYFKTLRPSELEPEPALSVAQFRRLEAEGTDVADKRIRGYVALSIPADCTTESFPAATVVLYDNVGTTSSALFLTGDGIGAASLQRGDCVEIALAGVVPGDRSDLYEVTAATDLVKIDSGHAIIPVWATPAQLIASTNEYVAAPLRIGRLYAERPGELFSADDNFFTDGEARIAVHAAATSVIGQLASNAATGTLCGICTYENETVQVVPVTEADVADFTGDVGIAEGEASIELFNTQYYEFPPQGGERIVECRVTAPAGMRLWVDLRNIDESCFSVEIAGDKVRLLARPNRTGKAVDYANCYLYLAQTKEGQRYVPQTIRLAQLGNSYESLPALIAANGGELASVHEALVNGVSVRALKLGSGNYTGHYCSDPAGAAGDRVLSFYALGWSEGDHDAATLYLRAVGGGSLSTTDIPLTINTGATGMAPFNLTVDDKSRYEVTLHDWTPGSAIEFSTSPTFDKKKDNKTGRALLFGLQID